MTNQVRIVRVGPEAFTFLILLEAYKNSSLSISKKVINTLIYFRQETQKRLSNPGCVLFYCTCR